MINKFTFDNGLRLLHVEDKTTPMVVVNTLYNVGSKHENPNQTGVAHLFEHLMFEGSKHVDEFDKYVQKAGGENNAFTSPDITNYYDVVPASNLELALWLESDRMKFMNLSEKTLKVQKDVVCEEFKQRYLTKPYADVWLELRPILFENHPYSWLQLGKT